MPQGVLNFSIEGTEERLTPRGGIVLLGGFLKAIGLHHLFSRYLPAPMSNSGLTPMEHLQPLLLMLHGGGRFLEDVRTIKEDQAMRDLLKMERVPTADGIGKWLKRTGLLGVYGLEKVNRKLLKRHLKSQKSKNLTLDIDASVIPSQKSIAETTYKKLPGFTPMIGHIDGGAVIHSEFRPGNIAPADHNLSFIQRCEEQLPREYSIGRVRADSASYQAGIFNYCEQKGITFMIGARLNRPVREAIESIKEWHPLVEKEGKEHHYQEMVGECLHTMGATHKAFRLIVVKKRVTPIFPALKELLSEEELEAHASEYYHVIATNAEESSTPKELVSFYRQRGECSENKIKELKNGFGLSYLPTSDFMANAFYFQIGVLAYNLFLLFKEMLDHAWQKHTISTIRYKLYHIAGKVITHGRRTILKVNHAAVEMLTTIRQQIYQVSLLT